MPQMKTDENGGIKYKMPLAVEAALVERLKIFINLLFQLKRGIPARPMPSSEPSADVWYIRPLRSPSFIRSCLLSSF